LTPQATHDSVHRRLVRGDGIDSGWWPPPASCNLAPPVSLTRNACGRSCTLILLLAIGHSLHGDAHMHGADSLLSLWCSSMLLCRAQAHSIIAPEMCLLCPCSRPSTGCAPGSTQGAPLTAAEGKTGLAWECPQACSGMQRHAAACSGWHVAAADLQGPCSHPTLSDQGLSSTCDGGLGRMASPLVSAATGTWQQRAATWVWRG